jgi:hypothetical protein
VELGVTNGCGVCVCVRARACLCARACVRESALRALVCLCVCVRACIAPCTGREGAHIVSTRPRGIALDMCSTLWASQTCPVTFRSNLKAAVTSECNGDLSGFAAEQVTWG